MTMRKASSLTLLRYVFHGCMGPDSKLLEPSRVGQTLNKDLWPGWGRIVRSDTSFTPEIRENGNHTANHTYLVQEMVQHALEKCHIFNTIVSRL